MRRLEIVGRPQERLAVFRRYPYLPTVGRAVRDGLQRFKTWPRCPDLSGVSPGDKVDFGIVLGSDDVYRITELTPQK